jgi:type I restriction enzyme S subunit
VTEQASDSQGLVPKLRFPEFRGRGAWLAKPLGQLCTPISEKAGNAKLTPVSITAGKGFVSQASKFGRDISGDQYRNYTYLRKGDFAYNKGNSTAFPQGYVCQLTEFDEAAASSAFLCFRLNDEYQPRFLQALFDQNVHGRQLASFITSGARSNGLLNIRSDDFYAVKMPCPPENAEQRKIADCLSSLDTLIAAETEKLTALRDHKKGLMHQLFPAEGETTPRLRFPEFQDAGEWVISSLETLVSLQSGSTPDKSNPLFWNGSIPWASAKDMKQLFLDDTQDHISLAAVNVGARLVPADSLLILTRGMTLLKDVPICVLRREMACNQDVKALVPRTGVNGLFLAFALLASKRRLLEMVVIAGHGTGKLNTDELEAIELALPRAAEQQRIVDLLTWLDKLLASQSARVKHLKSHKNGLMEQLFPSVAGAVA